MRNCYLAILLCILGTITASAAEITGFDIQFPVIHESYTVTTADGSFRALRCVATGCAETAQGDGSLNAVAVQFVQRGVQTINYGWFIFDAPYNALLTPGIYSGATRFPFESASNPGFDYIINDQGNDYLNGTFRIFEIIYGPDGSVQHFGASFVDYNNQGGVRATADVYYNYDVSSAPEPRTVGLGAIGALGILFSTTILRAFSRMRCRSGSAKWLSAE